MCLHLQLLLFHCVALVLTCEVSLHKCKPAKICIHKWPLHLCTYPSTAFLYIYDFIQCISQCITEALYQKKQSITTYETKVAKLQAQLEMSESDSAEKDTCIAKYEALVKGGEGKV